jgi:hypothetical protein
VVFTPCKLLICINIAVFLVDSSPLLSFNIFYFLRFLDVFLARFFTSRFEQKFFNSFRGFGC